MRRIASVCVFICLVGLDGIVVSKSYIFVFQLSAQFDLDICWFPFTQAVGSSNLCYLLIPEGETDPKLLCYKEDTKNVYPTPVYYYQPMDICYYLKVPGDAKFPEECCVGGLPPGR